MNSKFQQGALSLVWVAIFSALLAAVAMATLYSWRTERNLFAEGWRKLATSFQQTQRAAEVIAGVSAPTVFKCNVNGKVMYSNVACDAKDPASKKVDLQMTIGFEAPKVPIAAASETNGIPTLQDKIIEKATTGR